MDQFALRLDPGSQVVEVPVSPRRVRRPEGAFLTTPDEAGYGPAEELAAARPIPSPRRVHALGGLPFWL